KKTWYPGRCGTCSPTQTLPTGIASGSARFRAASPAGRRPATPEDCSYAIAAIVTISAINRDGIADLIRRFIAGPMDDHRDPQNMIAAAALGSQGRKPFDHRVVDGRRPRGRVDRQLERIRRLTLDLDGDPVSEVFGDV